MALLLVQRAPSHPQKKHTCPLPPSSPSVRLEKVSRYSVLCCLQNSWHKLCMFFQNLNNACQNRDLWFVQCVQPMNQLLKHVGILVILATSEYKVQGRPKLDNAESRLQRYFLNGTKKCQDKYSSIHLRCTSFLILS